MQVAIFSQFSLSQLYSPKSLTTIPTKPPCLVPGSAPAVLFPHTIGHVMCICMMWVGQYTEVNKGCGSIVELGTFCQGTEHLGPKELHGWLRLRRKSRRHLMIGIYFNQYKITFDIVRLHMHSILSAY